MKTHTAKRIHAKSLLAHYTKHEEKATSSQKWFTTGRKSLVGCCLFTHTPVSKKSRFLSPFKCKRAKLINLTLRTHRRLKHNFYSAKDCRPLYITGALVFTHLLLLKSTFTYGGSVAMRTWTLPWSQNDNLSRSILTKMINLRNKTKSFKHN